MIFVLFRFDFLACAGFWKLSCFGHSQTSIAAIATQAGVDWEPGRSGLRLLRDPRIERRTPNTHSCFRKNGCSASAP